MKRHEFIKAELMAMQVRESTGITKYLYKLKTLITLNVFMAFMSWLVYGLMATGLGAVQFQAEVLNVKTWAIWVMWIPIMFIIAKSNFYPKTTYGDKNDKG